MASGKSSRMSWVSLTKRQPKEVSSERSIETIDEVETGGAPRRTEAMIPPPKPARVSSLPSRHGSRITSSTPNVGVADAVIDLSRASLRAASSDVRKTGSTEEPSQYRNAVDAAIERRPSGVGLATIDGWSRQRKRNSQLSVLSEALDTEKEAFMSYEDTYLLPDGQLSDALRAQARLTSLTEAAVLLSRRDNLRVQHTADADVDELRSRHGVMAQLMHEAHATMISNPDLGAEGDFERAVNDGFWQPFPISDADQDRLFSLSKNMVGSADPSPAFKASAGATELAARQATTRAPVVSEPYDQAVSGTGYTAT